MKASLQVVVDALARAGLLIEGPPDGNGRGLPEITGLTADARRPEPLPPPPPDLRKNPPRSAGGCASPLPARTNASHQGRVVRHARAALLSQGPRGGSGRALAGITGLTADARRLERSRRRPRDLGKTAPVAIRRPFDQQ